MKLHDDWLLTQLQDADFAADYLTAAAEDPEPAVYLTALHMVAQVRGLGAVATAAGLTPTSIEQALSPGGDAPWATVNNILRATGLKLTVNAPH